jgi:hypothetical protein
MINPFYSLFPHAPTFLDPETHFFKEFLQKVQNLHTLKVLRGGSYICSRDGLERSVTFGSSANGPARIRPGARPGRVEKRNSPVSSPALPLKGLACKKRHCMQNSNVTANTGRLLKRLISGERPDSAPLEQIAEILATSEDRRLDRNLFDLIKRRLDEYRCSGLLPCVDSGETELTLNTAMLGVFRSGPNSSSPFGAGLPVPIYTAKGADLSNVERFLLRDGMWSPWADQWCGVERAAAPAAATPVTVAVSNPLPNTHLDHKVLATRLAGKYKGERTIADLHRRYPERPSIYYAAMNDDKTFNEAKFVSIAKDAGEYAGGSETPEGSSAVEAAMAGWGSPASKTKSV